MTILLRINGKPELNYMELKYDIVLIGGGPAGMAVAIAAKKAGSGRFRRGGTAAAADAAAVRRVLRPGGMSR